MLYSNEKGGKKITTRRIEAFEKWCYRRTFKINSNGMIFNEQMTKKSIYGKVSRKDEINRLAVY